jgi:hypothetical protein
VFLDASLAQHSDIFHLSKHDEHSHFVHVMQNLDEVSLLYDQYPMAGWMLQSSGMEWWVAYQLRYLQNVHQHANDPTHHASVREKHQNTWSMIASRHAGLCQRLVEANFDFSKVIELDWTDKLARIGTPEGAFE